MRTRIVWAILVALVLPATSFAAKRRVCTCVFNSFYITSWKWDCQRANGYNEVLQLPSGISASPSFALAMFFGLSQDEENCATATVTTLALTARAPAA